METVHQKLAVVTGASSGIGFELAKLAIADGFELIIAADETDMHDIAEQLRAKGGKVVSLVADLSGEEGVGELCAAIAEAGRPVDVLFANAGRGLGHGFLTRMMPNGFGSSTRTLSGRCSSSRRSAATCAIEAKEES